MATCWQNLPIDVSVATLHCLDDALDIARVALVNDHWRGCVVLALSSPEIRVLLENIFRSKYVELPLSFRRPEGLPSDVTRLETILCIGKVAEAQAFYIADTASGELIHYDVLTCAGFIPGQHCKGSKGIRPGERDILGYKDRKARVAGETTEKGIETAQHDILMDLQRALQAAVARIEPDEATSFLVQLAECRPCQFAFRGRVPAYVSNQIEGQRHINRRLAQPGPACIADVVGAVACSCRRRDTWSIRQLVRLCGTILSFGLGSGHYVEWLEQSTSVAMTMQDERSTLEQPKEVASPWGMRLLPGNDEGPNLCVGTALQARWRSQLAHPMWDAHKVLKPLVATGLCSKATEVAVVLDIIFGCIDGMRKATTSDMEGDDIEQSEQREGEEGGEGVEGEEGEAADWLASFAKLDAHERCIWAAFFLHYALADSVHLTDEGSMSDGTDGAVVAKLRPDDRSVRRVAELGALAP